MVTARRDTRKAVYDDLDTLGFSALHHALEAFLATKHAAGCHSVSHSQRRRVGLAILNALICHIALVRCTGDLHVVSLEDTHEVEGCHALLLVRTHLTFNIFEGATASESLILEVNFGVLVIHLHFMEALVAHPLSLNNEAALGKRIIVLCIINEVALNDAAATCTTDRERMGRWWLRELRSAKLSLAINDDDAPVVEATLPELAEVN